MTSSKKNLPIIVTAGQPYTDIDAWACAIAYAELLTLLGRPAFAYLPGKPNISVPLFALQRGGATTAIAPKHFKNAVVVDVSDPKFIAHAVSLEKVSEVYDHHPGFVDFWKQQKGVKSIIEPIGAAATLIWEQWVLHNKQKDISTSSADLLAIAIVSNTLNFQIALTSDRDRDAYERLLEQSMLPEDWKNLYYREIDTTATSRLQDTILHDTKIKDIPGFDNVVVIGQLELWQAQPFVENKITDIISLLEIHDSPYWLMNVPSIGEGKTYVYSQNINIQTVIEKVFQTKFNTEGKAVIDKCVLRKEILHALLDSR